MSKRGGNIADVSLVTAIQRVSSWLQRYGRAVCAHGKFEDPMQSTKQGGIWDCQS